VTTLVTADWHLSSNPRDEYRWSFVNDTLPRLMNQHKVTNLLILGDITEVKDNHGSRLVNRIVERMVELSCMAHITVLYGNHDGKPGLPAFFRFLGGFSRIQYVDVPTVRDNGDLLLPYTSNWERDWQTYRASHDGTIGLDGNFVFAHQTFEGARISRTRKMHGIPTDIFADGTNVISGDIHVPQDGKITYVGAPYTVDFGDDYEPRVILLGKSGRKSIPLKGPQKRLFEVTNVADLRKQTKRADALRAGDVVKIRVLMNVEDAARFEETRAAIEAWGQERSCTIHSTVPITELSVAKSKKLQESRGQRSDTRIVKDYSEQVEADDMTKRAGLAIVQEVS